MNELLEHNLHHHINQSSSYAPLKEILLYAILPAGKLFRPKLACMIFDDLCSHTSSEKELKNSQSDLSFLTSALEIHHAYTLVHDDLPCMDNDDYRRGKESVHKRFGEYKAVLCGDALLHESHVLMAKIQGPRGHKLRRYFSWSLGAKGLILGQVYDLSGVISSSFSSLLRTHELKTARLIQLALLGGANLAQDKSNYRDTLELMRLGSSIGITFQLLDDLSECVEKMSDHERDVSPFLRFPDQSLDKLTECLNTILSHTELKNTHHYILEYLNVMKKKIGPSLLKDKSLLQDQLGIDFCQKKLRPMMSLL